MTRLTRLLIAVTAAALIPACDSGTGGTPGDPTPGPGPGPGTGPWPAVNTPICTAANDQLDPRLASDGTGGAILAWQDNRNGAPDVYAQRVDSSGTVLWDLDGIPICTAADEQSHPVIATDGAGGAIIAWQDRRSGGGFDIYAQRVNGAGTSLWTSGGVAVCTAFQDQLEQQIISDGAGGAIIVWTDYRSQPPLLLYAQRINGAGVVQWTTDGVPLSTSGSCSLPQVVPDGASGAIVCWDDLRDMGTTGTDTYAQRISASGTLLWNPAGVAICTAADTQIESQLAPDGAGGAIIVWEDERAGPLIHLYAQHIDGAGTTLWATDGIPVATATNYEAKPQVAPDGSGGAIVVWQGISGSNFQIFVQRLTGAGSKLWTADGIQLTNATNLRSLPQVAPDGAGGAVLVWEDWRAGEWDIYGQRLNGAGVSQWTTNGVALCTVSGQQNRPHLVTDSSARSIMVWDDQRAGTTGDIYAQGVDAAGIP